MYTCTCTYIEVSSIEAPVQYTCTYIEVSGIEAPDPLYNLIICSSFWGNDITICHIRYFDRHVLYTCTTMTNTHTHVVYIYIICTCNIVYIVYIVQLTETHTCTVGKSICLECRVLWFNYPSLHLYTKFQLTCPYRCMRCLTWTLPAGLPW